MEGAVKDESKAQHQVPEWETGDASQKRKPFSNQFRSIRLSGILPPHKEYLGLRRRTFLIVLAAVLIALVGLIIGLAVGLTVGRKRYMIYFRAMYMPLRC